MVRHGFADGTGLDSRADPDVFARPDRTPRSAPAPATDWRRLCRAGRADLGGRPRRRSSSRRSTARATWPRLAVAAAATCAAIAPGRTLRGLGRALPARPAAAHAARPLRHLHRLRPAPGAGRAGRGPVRRADASAAGTCAAGWAPLADALLDRAAGRSAATVRTGADGRPGSTTAGGRVAGVRLAGGGRLPGRRGGGQRRRRAPSTATCCRTAAAAPAAPRHRRRWPASCCCSASAGGRPGWPTTTCSSRADYDAEFDAVFGDPAPRPVGADPTSSSASPTTRRSARTGTRRGSCWSTRRGTARARARSTGDAPGLRRRVRRPAARPARRAAGCDVRDRLLFSRGASPRPTWSGATGAPGGAIYGTSPTARRRLPAPGQPLAGARAVPGRRLHPPRRRAAAGRPVRPDRRRLVGPA